MNTITKFTAAVVLAASPVLAQSNSVLWYDTPAKPGMNEALPVGNGRIGALVYGGERERLVLNDSSLWTGGENPTGDYNSMGSYQMLGELLLTPTAPGAAAVPVSTTPGISVPSGQKAYYDHEEAQFAADGNPATKWCVEHKDKPVIWQATLPAPAAVNSYAFTSCPDYPARDPKNWEFSGSNDGQTWTALDKHENQPAPEKRGQPVKFTFANTSAYRFYRFTIQPNAGMAHIQIAEIAVPGVSVAQAAAQSSAAPDDFRRELDIATATAVTEYSKNGVKFRREVFASRPDDVIAVRWSASKPGALSGTVELKGTHGETTETKNGTLSFSGKFPNDLQYTASARVIAKGGAATVENGKMVLSGCDEATIIIAAGTSYVFDYAKKYNGENPAPRVAQQLENAAKKPFSALQNAQRNDFQAFFTRVNVDFGTTGAERAAFATDKRKVRQAAEGGDPDLEELMFQYGRYLLIGCSRPGALPANLQGLWCDSNNPPWHSDYHANINIQMNYWPAEVTNLAEFHTPLFDLVSSQLEPWRKATAADKNFATPGKPSRGFAVRTSHNIHGGMGWKWDKTANAWYGQHFWEHYAFGGDKEYLRKVAYPVLKETCEFWEDRLKTLPDGRLVVPNAWSPEHGPDEDGVSYSQQIVWDLFDNYVRAADALSIDADYRAKIAAMQAKLVGPKIGKWGQLQEWMIDRDDPNNHHRHTSHLFAVFPGRQVSVAKTPEFAKAAKISLDARGIDAGSDVREWSFAWRTALYARLHDAESAHTMFKNLFSNRNTCQNLFGLHPPMQIDGNFGITAGVAEMLLQSHEDEINLLPALPKAWPSGSFSGLRARGGVTVDAMWQNGKLTGATLRSTGGGTVKVRSGDKIVDVKLKPGGAVKLNADLRS